MILSLIARGFDVRTPTLAVIALLFAAAGVRAQTPAPAAGAPDLGTIATAASAERIRSDLTALVGFGTRHTLSDTLSETRGIGAARRWVHGRLSEISRSCGGCIDTEYHTVLVPPARRIPDTTAVVNVLGFQRGSSDPNRYIIISGHLDSRASDVMDAEIDAPGAVDDASGVAAVLEVARLLSGYRFPATIVYAAVTGEEQGLYGSTALAERAEREGWFVEAMLNNDVVGNVQGIDGVVDSTTVRVFSEGVRADESEDMARARRALGGEVDSPARQLARYVHRIAERHAPNLDVMMVYRLDRYGRGGDHIPFSARGFPAVRLAELHEDYRRQHQDVRVEDGVAYGDVLDEAEPSYTARVAGLNAAVIASLAAAPSPPSGVEARGAVQPSTTLRWQVVDRTRAPTLTGYRVYWRETTSPVWQHSVFIGDTSEHTLENVVIDNWFFGVASVAEGGFESPIVFAGPVGAWGPAPGPDGETSGAADGAARQTAALRAALLEMGALDQEVRAGMGPGSMSDTVFLERMMSTDSMLSLRLREIVERHGWPDAERLGQDAVRAAFLIVQHTPFDDFRQAMLPHVERDVRAGVLDGQDYAMMVDRVRLRSGRPQFYGSQYSVAEGVLVRDPVEDPDGLDARRTELGLMPMAEYERLLSEHYGMEVSRER